MTRLRTMRSAIFILFIQLNLVYSQKTRPPTNEPTAVPTASPTSEVTVDYSCLHRNLWKVNDNNDFSYIFNDTVDIINSTYSFEDEAWEIFFNTLINYTTTLSQDDIDALNSRPNAQSGEFKTGATTAVAGKPIVWGSDIGYSGCNGYWPPGPKCPVADLRNQQFSLFPAIEMQEGGCYIKEGAKAYGLNGVALFIYGDGFTYNDTGVWGQLAPVFEKYDMDICQAEQAGDNFTGHSPLYAFAFDSYPIYGPYQDTGTPAVSCWQVRDYSPDSLTGCSDGERSCVLVDEFNITLGTVPASVKGPSFTDTDISASGNVITTSNGVYYEDYFYNETCGKLGGVYLNEFNGHDHGDYGFHYHITLDSSGTPTFPYILGPKYYGCVAGGTCCETRDSCSKRSVCGETRGKELQNQHCVYAEGAPTPFPSTIPTPLPSPIPSPAPTTSEPTPKPTKSPIPNPTWRPTPDPTPRPSPAPKPSRISGTGVSRTVGASTARRLVEVDMDSVDGPMLQIYSSSPSMSNSVFAKSSSIKSSRDHSDSTFIGDANNRQLATASTSVVKFVEAFSLGMLAILNRADIRGVDLTIDDIIENYNYINGTDATETIIIYTIKMTLEDTIYDQLPDLISALSLSINETQSSGEFKELLQTFVPELTDLATVEYQSFNITSIEELDYPSSIPTSFPTRKCVHENKGRAEVVIAAVCGTLGAFMLSLITFIIYYNYVLFPNQSAPIEVPPPSQSQPQTKEPQLQVAEMVPTPSSGTKAAPVQTVSTTPKTVTPSQYKSEGRIVYDF